MAFQSTHGLTWDGNISAVETAALQAAASNPAANQDPNPYNYVFVNQNRPQTATVFSGNPQVYQTLANTGQPGATTQSGTFPVYLRFTVTTMTGTNPNGSHYSDPGIPWVSYFNGGDALHGFIRASYGFPQSDGCVEMPPANAAVVFPLTPIGTLVTVN
jgi:lipoprotein-anchoring transpeptidase ErfK/SrfK